MIKPALSLLALSAVCASACAAGVRFVVVDANGKPVKDGLVVIDNAVSLLPLLEAPTGATVDLRWLTTTPATPDKTILIRLGQTISLQQQTEPPVKDIYITVTATRLKRPA